LNLNKRTSASLRRKTPSLRFAKLRLGRQFKPENKRLEF